MIEKIISDNEDNSNYCRMDKNRKLKYQKIYKSAACCPEKYILSVDVANPNSMDQSCVVKYNYEEYLRGNLKIEGIEYF